MTCELELSHVFAGEHLLMGIWSLCAKRLPA